MTDQQIKDLWDEFHTPLHVRRHCETVADFCAKLGQKLVERGEKLDMGSLRRAALLHDMVRVVDFRKFNPENFPAKPSGKDIEVWTGLREKYAGMHHADAAADLLEERGEHVIAEIVRKHKFVQILDGFETLEEKVLYYADKRVKHDKVVTLGERLEDGKKRNGPDNEDPSVAKKMDDAVFALEKELFMSS